MRDIYRERARNLTELETYIPAIADAMRAKGIFSSGELWEAIKPWVETYPDFFENVTYQSVNTCVRFERTQAYKESDYSRTSYAIAAALDKSPEELFGPLPEFAPTIQSKEQAAIAFEIWGDAFERTTTGLQSFRDNEDLHTLLHYQLDTLTDKQRVVIDYSFGFDGTQLSRPALADQFGISHQRISQIMKNGLQSLREDEESELLKPYLEGPTAF